MKRKLPPHLTTQQKIAIRENEKYEQMGMFLPLNADDAKDYQQWARDNFQAEFKINPTWHPAVINECIKIINETYNNGNQ